MYDSDTFLAIIIQKKEFQSQIDDNYYHTASHQNNPTVEGVGLPMEEVVNGPVQAVPGDEEKSKYASVVTSPLGMLPPIKDDQTVQYQAIDHKAAKVG